MFLQNRNFSKEILTIIIIPPWFQACIYWKKVCYMTTSFTAIHFFYDSVIISRQHLKQSTCQENCLYFTILFATIHYNKPSAVDSRKSWRVCLFEENHCSPAILKVSVYFTEQVAIISVTEKSYRDPILSWWTSIAKLLNNTVPSVRVNETKLTLKNAFFLDPFALGGKKESKCNEKTPVWGSLQKLDLSVNP